MFFFWTPGIPLILSIAFALASIFVFYCFYRALRGSFWGGTEYDPGAMRMDDDSLALHDAPWRCERRRCLTMNPRHAKFCRMCGAARHNR